MSLVFRSFFGQMLFLFELFVIVQAYGLFTLEFNLGRFFLRVFFFYFSFDNQLW